MPKPHELQILFERFLLNRRDNEWEVKEEYSE